MLSIYHPARRKTASILEEKLLFNPASRNIKLSVSQQLIWGKGWKVP